MGVAIPQQRDAPRPPFVLNPSDPAARNLVAWYIGADVHDYSGNGHTGAFGEYGTDQDWVRIDGWPYKSWDFDGAGPVMDLPEAVYTRFVDAQAMTLEFWTVLGANVDAILCGRHNSPDKFWLRHDPSGSDEGWLMRVVLTGGARQANSGSSIDHSVGVLTHVVGTWSGDLDEVSVYVNAVHGETISTSGTLTSGGDTMQIGNHGGGSSKWRYNGEILQARFYDTHFDAERVAAHFHDPYGLFARPPLTFSESAAAGALVELPAGAMTVEQLTPVIAAGVNVTAPIGAITAAGPAPTILTGAMIAPPTGALAQGGHAPDILTNDIDVPAGPLSLSGMIPAIIAGNDVAPSPAARPMLITPSKLMNR